jgi:DNA-binding SARP family transcriptional activator
MEVLRMKSVQSGIALNETVRQKIIKQLETALSGIHALQNVQLTLTTEQLTQTTPLLKQALEMVGETTWRMTVLLGKITNHLEPALALEGMYSSAPNWFNQELTVLQDLYGSMTQRDFKKTFALSHQQHVLEVQTLKHLEIRLNGQVVRFPFAKCAELIVWLALNGAASKDQICDELWDGRATRSNLEYFRVVVRRTRNALVEAGELELNPLTFEHGLYQLSPKLELQVDVLELANALKNPNPEHLRDALDLYHGEFMPYTTSEWASLKRTVIVDLALDIAIELAQSLEQHQPRQAIEAYKRALEIEPLSEIATARLMRLYKQFGESLAAESVRKAYQKMLD